VWGARGVCVTVCVRERPYALPPHDLYSGQGLDTQMSVVVVRHIRNNPMLKSKLFTFCAPPPTHTHAGTHSPSHAQAHPHNDASTAKRACNHAAQELIRDKPTTQGQQALCGELQDIEARTWLSS
jgi:hypothetical protein